MTRQLSAAEKIAYKLYFDDSDLDHDGKIDFNEFCNVIQEIERPYPRDSLYDMFEHSDKDRNNRISFDEFCLLLPRIEAKYDYQIYMDAFQEFDLNKDGQLTKQEIQFAMMKLGKFVKSDKVKKLIDSVDENANGKVDYEEFIKMIPQIYD